MAVSNNMSLVYNWFIQHGYSPTLAAGFAANFAVETGGGEDINPDITSPNGAYGIAQWLDESRQSNFRNFIDEHGYDSTDIYAQLEFVDWELHNTESQALEEISNSDLSSAESAAAAIADYYERCQGQALDLRQQVAGEVYSNLYGGESYDASATGSSESSSGGTDTEDYTSYLPDDMKGIDGSMYQRLGMLFKKAQELGVTPLLTAGANDDSHVENSWHYKGLGADIAWEGLQWGDDTLSALADYARSLGFQEVISDPHGTGPHLHVANPDLSKEVNALLGPKQATTTFGEGVFTPKMQNMVSPEIQALADAKLQMQKAYEESLKEKPSILEGIWHDFKRSGNFAYEFVDALYTDLFHSDLDAFGRDKITDADRNYIKAAMGSGNEAEAQWIIDNAKDPTQLYYLLQKKSDEMAEDTKYAAYYNSVGTHTLGTVLGAVLDPLNALPELKFLQAGKIMKTLGGVVKDTRIIDSAAKASAEKILSAGGAKRIGDTTLNMAAMGALQQHAANMGNGTDDSIAGAAMIAGISGGVLRTLGMAGKNLFHKDPAVANLARTADRIETSAAREAVGLKTPYTIMDTKEAASKLHDVEYFTKQEGKIASSVVDRDDVFALSLKDAKKLGASMGIKVSDNTKGFFVPHGDYTVVVKDNIKGAKELEGVLAHEIGVHQSLKDTIGTDRYQSLMDFVSTQSKDTTSKFAQAARLANSTDPEEILGYAIQHDMLSRKSSHSLVSSFREGLKEMGFGDKSRFTNNEILDMVNTAVRYQGLKKQGIIVNPDGSIIQNGVHFSKDNMLAPESLLDYEKSADELAQERKGKTAFEKTVNTLSGWMDNTALTRTPYGAAYHSPSMTLAKKASELWEDAQRRGTSRNGSNMPSAERMKDYLMGQLDKYKGEILDARKEWIRDHYGTMGVINPYRKGDAHRQEFDKLVIDKFNSLSKQQTHINIDDTMVDKNVMKAVKSLQNLYDTRIDLGKNSSSIFGGSMERNLIEDGWYSVDDEFHRLVDPDAYREFVSNFTTTGDRGARAFMEQYALAASNTPTSRKLIGDMIKREKELKLQREIHDAETYLNKEGRKSSEKVKRVKEDLEQKRSHTVKDTTDAEIDEFRKTKCKAWADNIMQPLEDKLDGLDTDGASSKLGDLNFFRGRLPMDTGIVMDIKDAEGNVVKAFSFDNDLRYYDLEHTLNRTNRRFAGEVAVRNVLGSANEYGAFVKKVLHELRLASMGNDGRINSSTAEKNKRWFLDNIARLRGMRDHYERNIYDEGSAVTKILNNFAYFKRGGSMGWNQLGDLGGAIAYGGLKQVFGVFNPLRKFVQDVRLGKANSEMVEDLSWHVFGEPVERYIFRGNWGDTQTRNALSKRGFGVDNLLISAADMTHNLGKFTSQINMLGHMTDTMVRSARSAAITDSIRWAHGETFNALRNPFSKANIKALGRHVDLAQLKKDLRTYVKWDGKKGTVADGFDVDAWRKERPDTFWAWYDLMQNQVEKSVLLSSSEGNRNMLKDTHSLMRLVMMFKDFNMRSNNAQFMRMLQQHEAQDAMAFALSLMTNTAAFAARNGAKMATLYALGQTDAANYIKENYMNDKALAKAAFFRTGFLSPMGVANDFWEAGTGAPTIRTTVSQYRNNPPKDFGDFVGNSVQQLPAVDTLSDMTWKPIRSAYRLATSKGTQKDLRTLLNLAPIPDFIPYTQAIDTLAKLNSLKAK
nr:MAG: tail lysozyme [Bacteriophage sp.]